MAGELDVRDLELNALLEVTQAINSNLSEADLFKIYRFTLLGDLKINRLALFTVSEDQWHCKVNFGTDVDWSTVQLPQEFIDLEDPRPVGTPGEFAYFDLVFPVLHKKKQLAVVFIGGLKNGEGHIDTTFLRALTNILIVAIENKRLARRQLEQEAYRKELEIAKKVQNFLFPKSLPKTPRLKIDAVYLPHHDVGGDYYDYLQVSEDKFMLCVADVSGKGVPAALLMSNFQASLRTLVRKTDELDEIIAELNHATYVSSNAENFITFFVAFFDFKTRELSYANCGHNPTYVLKGDEIMALEKGSTILGMFDPLPFINSDKIILEEPFLLFGYTDGLTETFSESGEQFGVDRLQELLSKHKNEDLSFLHHQIFRSLDEFRKGNEYGDDITVISCHVS
ncbi:MAG: PP2C family protein-serine/threonine phosphatase [Cyclobacteriaceae bacterium]